MNDGGQCAKDRKEWRALGCSPLPGMQLHDAVGINCKKGATTENQGSGVKYMYLSGAIRLTPYSMVWDWRVS